MSKKSFNSSFIIAIKPSLQKALIILLPHCFILILITSLSIFSIGLKFILVLLVLLSLTYYIRNYLLQSSSNAVFSIKQDSAKNWYITTYKSLQSDSELLVDILPTSFISRWLIILNFKDSDHSHYNVIFTPDSISKDQFRLIFSRIKLTYIN